MMDNKQYGIIELKTWLTFIFLTIVILGIIAVTTLIINYQKLFCCLRPDWDVASGKN